jgi:hypothetical protein
MLILKKNQKKMNNKGKLTFVIVVVIVTLLLKHRFQISSITLKDAVYATLAGIIAVLVIGFLQRTKDMER